ncbi:hypothetical protein RMATCC62417_14787 [Rhizopus microsporus]|nr:hypothetical protein RMATCC62417_14787 [Rhizopus microsporus]
MLFPVLTKGSILHSKHVCHQYVKLLFRSQAYSTKTVFDKQSIQFLSVRRTFNWMYISAGVQLMFWGNLASLAYVAYAVKDG